MIYRRATQGDIKATADIYEEIHLAEAKGITTCCWKKGIYPVESTAQNALDKGWLFVAEEDGVIYASAIINKVQVDVYAEAAWEYQADPDNVMVLHTLAVSPSAVRKGIGKGFVNFYEQFAKENGCKELRMDTNERNIIARELYRKLGYKEVSVIPCIFNGIPGVGLVCLEKNLG